MLSALHPQHANRSAAIAAKFPNWGVSGARAAVVVGAVRYIIPSSLGGEGCWQSTSRSSVAACLPYCNPASGRLVTFRWHLPSFFLPMGTPAERKALLFLALVAFLGAGVRALGAPRGAEAGDAAARRALREQINAVEAARRSGASGAKRTATSRGASGTTGAATSKPAAKRAPSARSSKKPELPLEAIDVDMASAAELEALPGIGPALALRIVEDRNYNGPFGSLTGLQRVRGIGPALSNRLTPHVTFSGTPRPTSAVLDGRSPSMGTAASRSVRRPP